VKKILFPIVFACPVAIWAQEIKPIDAKPGLWENTSTMEMSGAAMPNMPQISPEQLAQMPPEARARVEAMMKGNGGSPRTNTAKVCITREQLSQPLFNSGQRNCTYKLTGSAADSQQIHVECTTGNTQMAGDLKLERVDSEHVKGNMVMKATGDSTSARPGASVNIKTTFSGKWLSSDCGDVKPAADGK